MIFMRNHSPASHNLRATLRILHRRIGVLLGIWLVLVSLSGGLLVFREEIEVFFNRDLTQVAPLGSKAPLQPALDRARLEHPNAVFKTVNIPEAPGRSISFWGHDPEGRSFHVYTDPYTGHLLGSRLAESDVTEWLYLFHAQLLGGSWGERVNGASSLAWTVLLVAGILLWIPTRGRSWTEGLRVLPNAGWRRQAFDLHRAVGFWAVLPMLAVVITGAYFPFNAPFEWLISTLTTSSAAESAPIADQRPAMTSGISLDRVLEVSSAVLPEAPPNWIRLPEGQRSYFTVRKHLPGDWRLEGSQHLKIDSADGRLLSVDLQSERTRAQRILRSIFPIHAGTFGGTITRALWVGLGFVPLVLFVTSVSLWMTRGRAAISAPRTSQ